MARSLGAEAFSPWTRHRRPPGRYGRAVRWLGVLVAAVLVGGCAPAAGDRPAGSAGSAAPITLPPRPHELRIDGVDPCSLITERQRAELGLDPRADPFVDDSRLYGGAVPSCLFQARSPRAVTVSTGIVTTVGVERFVDGELEADLRSATVDGFPVVVALPRQARDYCSALIDVAPGQLVDVVYRDVALAPPIAQDELCAAATRVAGGIVHVLAGR